MSAALLVQDGNVQLTEYSAAIYRNEIPPFVEAELQRLYGHIYSSLAFIQTSKPAGQISTYVARRGTTPSAVLLFWRSGRSIVVLNHTVEIDRMELRRFAERVFREYPSVGVISFAGIHTDLLNFPYPVQRGHAMEDIYITLPATADDYTARLGKSTRSNLRYYRSRLEKSFTSVKFECFEKEEIDEQTVYELIKLSEMRISAKRINFGINSDYARRIVDLLKICGVVNVIRVDGQLCAGAISFRIGANQMTEVIAHDEKYNAYSPGMLCFYLAICESIPHGVKTYHLGGGRLSYKVRLLGVQRDMERLEIYRSHVGMLLNLDRVSRNMANAGVLRLKTWLRAHENSLPVRLILESRHALRSLVKSVWLCVMPYAWLVA